MRIAVTAGEPAGIGPDLCLALGQQDFLAESSLELIIIGSLALFTERARLLDLDLPLAPYEPDDAPRPGTLRVLDVPLGAPCVAGRLDTANARHVLNMLDRAIDGARRGEFAAMVTAP